MIYGQTVAMETRTTPTFWQNYKQSNYSARAVTVQCYEKVRLNDFKHQIDN